MLTLRGADEVPDAPTAQVAVAGPGRCGVRTRCASVQLEAPSPPTLPPTLVAAARMAHDLAAAWAAWAAWRRDGRGPAWRMARRSGTRKTQLGGGARGLALFIGPFIRTLSGPRSSSAHGLGSPQRAGTREQGAQH